MDAHGVQAGTDNLDASVRLAADATVIHPVRDYLARLRWDGQPRIDTWLTAYLGVEDTEYARRVGAWWLISGVARITEPGCKVDHALILEGPQGIGKSSALRALCADSEWFNDSDILGLLGSKDAYLNLQGKLIIEFAELSGLNKKDAAQVKAFVTGRVDTFRPPFGRRSEDVQRQCIFAGTVNPNGLGYLRDETGGRRFWPVACTTVDHAALVRDRDQLWAEAAARYKRGARWWPQGADEHALCASEQAERALQDPWQEDVETYLLQRRRAGDDFVTTADVLGYLGKDTASRRGHDMNRANACISQVEGWERDRRRVDGRVRRGFSWVK